MIHRIVWLASMVLLIPLGLRAQGDAPGPTEQRGPKPYGTGEAAPLNYATEPTPTNLLLFSLGAESGYNDNILSTSSNRQSDTTFLFSPRMALQERRSRLSVALDYSPDFLLYRHTSGYNALNHSLGLDFNYRVTSRFSLRLLDSFGYRTGIFQPHPGESFVPGLASPNALNQTVFTPLAKELDNSTRLDVVYEASARTLFDWFGGYQRRDFRQVSTGLSLFNFQGANAGFRYSYRLTRHTTLGALYAFQNLNFQEGQRTQVHSGSLSLARDLSAFATISIFGGPEYSHLRDHFVLPVLPFPGVVLAIPVDTKNISWSTGGSLHLKTSKTVFEVSGERRVSEGGGVFGAVISSSVLMDVHRRLSRRWNAIWDLSYGNSDSLGGIRAGRSVSSETGAFHLERTVTENLTARIGYAFLRQVSGTPPVSLPNFHRNFVTFGLFYRFKQIPLGR